MAQGQKPFYIVLGVVVLAGVVMIGLRYRGGGPISIPVNPAILPADTSGFRGYLLGSEAAPVEITEYGDFQCPVCQSFATIQFPDVHKRLIETGKVRFRFRDFPLDDIHSNPRVAAHAAACGDAQGRFWEMAHGIFARQGEWSPKSNPASVFREVATETGLDVDKWNKCMQDGTYAGRIQASALEGVALGVNSTPAFIIGGKIYSMLSSDQMVQIVDSIIGTQAAAKP